MVATNHNGVITLSGECPVEDAEPLLALLEADPGAPVDLAGARHLHGAVFQVLLARATKVNGPAADAFVADWLLPCLPHARQV